MPKGMAVTLIQLGFSKVGTSQMAFFDQRVPFAKKHCRYLQNILAKILCGFTKIKVFAAYILGPMLPKMNVKTVCILYNIL